MPDSATKPMFSRYVEPGRLCYINYGPGEGKMCTVVDIIDLRRVVIDGPTTGVPRQQIPVGRLSLTDFTTPNICRGAREKTVKKALAADKTFDKWSATTWAKKIKAKEVKKSMNDFDRFKLMLARRKKSGMLKAEIKKVVKGGAKKGKK